MKKAYSYISQKSSGKLSFPAALLIMLAVWMSFFLIPKPLHIEVSGDSGYLSLAGRDISGAVYIVGADSWDSYPEQYYCLDVFVDSHNKQNSTWETTAPHSTLLVNL